MEVLSHAFPSARRCTAQCSTDWLAPPLEAPVARLPLPACGHHSVVQLAHCTSLPSCPSAEAQLSAFLSSSPPVLRPPSSRAPTRPSSTIPVVAVPDKLPPGVTLYVVRDGQKEREVTSQAPRPKVRKGGEQGPPARGHKGKMCCAPCVFAGGQRQWGKGVDYEVEGGRSDW